VTRAQWLALTPGDVLVSRRGTLRPVLKVHVHTDHCRKGYPPRAFVTLAKVMRVKWTPGPTTTYLFSDAVNMGLEVTGRRVRRTRALGFGRAR
jgi:hypothetical protein